MIRKLGWSWLLLAPVLGLGLTGTPLAGQANQPAGVNVAVADRTLPKSFHGVADIRWAANGTSLLLAHQEEGIIVWDWRHEDASPEVLWKGGVKRRADILWLPSRLGVSQEYVVAAASLFYVMWRDWKWQDFGADFAFEAVLDLDVHEDRLVVLGLRRDAKKRLAHDGAIAWLGNLNDDLRGLEPIWFSETGRGAEAMDHCVLLETGAVRFLRDGSFVVAAGVEPGIRLFDDTGKRLASWNNDVLRVYSFCDLTDEQVLEISAQPQARSRWINHRRVLDDIIELDGEPTLIVRSLQESLVRWELIVLHRDGRHSEVPFTVTSPHSNTRLRADVSDQGDLALLLFDPYDATAAAAKPRVVIMSLK